MQRDQKVGLALGVLLIGAVAAFFFRNEPDPSLRLPQLESAEAVNREIAEQRLAPYLSETETSDTGQALSRADAVEARTGERRLPRWEELKTESPDPFLAEGAAGQVPTPAPDPIPSADARTELGLAQAQTQQPVIQERITVTTSPTETLHEVQRGETLSSIAGKHLGSQARYLEIFEANQDQLKDANDLQVGMKLKIPVTGSPSASKPSSITNASTVGDPKPVTATASPANEAPVFVPASTATTLEPPLSEDASSTAFEPKAEAAAEQPKLKFAPAKRRPRVAKPIP